MLEWIKYSSPFNSHLPTRPRRTHQGRENALVNEAAGSLNSFEVTLWRSEITVLMPQGNWFLWPLVSIRDKVNPITVISRKDGEHAGIYGNQWLIDHQILQMNWTGSLLSYFLTTGRKMVSGAGTELASPEWEFLTSHPVPRPRLVARPRNFAERTLQLTSSLEGQMTI